MDPLSARHGIEESQRAKADLQLEMENLPVERKIEMVQRLIKVACEAGTLPDWYYRLMEIPKPVQR